jgi:hypothetical protein
MAIRGAKPTASVVKLVTGKRGRVPVSPEEPRPDGRPRAPTPLQGRPLALWRRFINKAWWLTEADSPKAWLWCHLQAEAEEDVAKMTAARIGQLRALGSELGFDPSSRTRLGAITPPKRDELDKYFDH